MTDLDPDIDWVSLLESQGAGPEKYHAHSNAHAMACQKYTVAAQQAKLSGNSERAKLLRKIGKKHKLVADTLAAIANDHVGATYSIQMKKKAQLMPKKKKQPVQESIEQVDEISKGLASRYIKKAAQDLHVSGHSEGGHDATQNNKAADSWSKRAGKRKKGIGKAVDRLTKEELEMEDEVILDEDTIAALDELAESGVLDEYLRSLDEGVNEEELEQIEEDEAVDPVRAMIGFAITEQPLDFQDAVHFVLGEIVSEQLAELKDRLQEALAADADGSDEDSEEDSEESPELQGEATVPANDFGGEKKPNPWLKTKKSKAKAPARSEGSKSLDKFKGRFSEAYRYATTEPGPEGHGTKPPMGQVHLSEPTGKKFPSGRQDVDANTLPKIGTKKKSQKGTTVAAGDTVRTQRAAD